MMYHRSWRAILCAAFTALFVLAPVAAEAGERSCREVRSLRSLNSNRPTQITFVNTSGMYRSVNWIDFKGQSKSYGGINPNETKTFQTYATHVWEIATGPGDCLQVFVAEGRPLIVELPRKAVDGPRAAPPQPARPKPLTCARNYELRNGICVVVQNCGPNAFRNREGDCDCNKHYAMVSGRCVPAASTCKPNEVYSSSVAQCIPRSLGR